MKAEIVERLIEEQEHVIQDLEHALNERKEAADIDEDDTLDADDFAQQEMNKDFIRKFSEQLSTAHDDLAILKSYKYRSSEKFSPGALVETDKHYFLVGAAVHNVEHNNKQVICISTHAPVYKMNEGKKAGDEMKMGKQAAEILSIQ